LRNIFARWFHKNTDEGTFDQKTFGRKPPVEIIKDENILSPGTMPTGIITTDKTLSPEGIKNCRKILTD